MSFKEIEVRSLNENFFTKIGEEWMLVTAGTRENFNTMTASWGGVGVLWGSDVTFTFIRQSRYTLDYMKSNPYYSLCFFDGDKQKEMAFCGSNSGRDVDKVAATGLTPAFAQVLCHSETIEVPYFEEAALVLVCKKLYRQTMTPDCFIDKSILDKQYSSTKEGVVFDNFHDVFVGKIAKVLKKN